MLRAIRMLAVAVGSILFISHTPPVHASIACSFSEGTLSVQVTSPDSAVRIAVVSGSILIEGESGPATCVDESGSVPTVSNTDLIWVYGSSEFLIVIVDLGGGPFAPGLTPEDDDSSEIEIQVDWPPPSRNRKLEDSFVVVLGSPARDELATGRKSNESVAINLNAEEAKDDLDLIAGTRTTFAGFGLMVVAGKGGNDRLSGTNADIEFERFLGGPGNDVIRGGKGLDLLFGQAGNDVLLGGGDSDFLSGGSGKDRCVGGPAKDIVKGCESGSA
jgi:hypothetical protein